MDRTAEASEKPALNWKRANWLCMRDHLATTDWTVMREKSVEEMWAFFRSRISETVMQNVPRRTVRKRARPAWMTQQILAAIRRKRRLWAKAKKGRDVEEYVACEKEVKRMIPNAKRSFEKRLAGENGGDSRPFYSYIKQRTKSKPGIGPLKNEKREVVSEDQGMAELLNKFFGSVFTREDTEHIPTAADMETTRLEEVNITARAVKEKIRNLKTESAAGPDEIGTKLLKELEAEITPPLVEIFKKSSDTGEVPEDWKTANVTPIFKKGSKADPGNYRCVPYLCMLQTV
jgi:hypothetical protein